MNRDSDSVKQEMWSEAARRDAFYYSADSRRNWEEEDFFLSGASDAENFTTDFFEEMNFNPRGKKMLDIGCGLGRMTRAFASMFDEAYGVDFSEEMIEKARDLNMHIRNLTFSVNTGRDLSIYEDNTFDFCFSYFVFQHITSMQILASYIREIARVLKPGGLFKFQVRARYSFAGRIRIPRFIGNFVHTKLLRYDLLIGLLALLLRRDMVKVKAYSGISLSRQQLEELLSAIPLAAIQITENGGLWCSGRKAVGETPV